MRYPTTNVGGSGSDFALLKENGDILSLALFSKASESEDSYEIVSITSSSVIYRYGDKLRHVDKTILEELNVGDYISIVNFEMGSAEGMIYIEEV